MAVVVNRDGGLQRPSLPDRPSGGVTCFVTNPGSVVSEFVSQTLGTHDEDLISVVVSDTVDSINNDDNDSDGSGTVLVVHGASTQEASSEQACAAVFASLSSLPMKCVVVVTGLTSADCTYGLGDTRHGRTLYTLFQAPQLCHKKQLRLAVEANDDAGVDVEAVRSHVKELYNEATSDQTDAPPFEDAYDVELVFVSSTDEAEAVSRSLYTIHLYTHILFFIHYLSLFVCLTL